jgi:hypothetical protein
MTMQVLPYPNERRREARGPRCVLRRQERCQGWSSPRVDRYWRAAYHERRSPIWSLQSPLGFIDHFVPKYSRLIPCPLSLSMPRSLPVCSDSLAVGTIKRLSDPADLLNITCISLQQSTSSGACARLNMLNSVTSVFDGSGVDSESAFSLDGMLCTSVERSPTAEQRLNQLGRHFQSSIWSYSDETSQSHTQATCQQT